ncbi:MAG: ABC transporter ATP-binding protein [Actinomycetaceae bacterium]|nr:ABC transporter ATP-binding protein [Actinomycetaceae bacterium]
MSLHSNSQPTHDIDHTSPSEMKKMNETPQIIDQQPPLRTIIKWLTGITRPVHAPLLVSAMFRIVTLTLDIALFAVAGGGLVAIIHNDARVWPVFVSLAVIAVVKAGAAYFEQFSGHYVAFKALELLRTHIFSHLWPKAPAVMQHSKSGDILASITRDVDRIEVFYAHTFAPIVGAFIVPLVVVPAAASLAGWDMLWMVALCVALSLLVVPALGSRMAFKATRQTLAIRRELTHHVTDSVSGVNEVVGYGLENQRITELDAIETRLRASAVKPRAAMGARRALNIVLMLVSTASVMALGIWYHYDPVSIAAIATGTLRLFEGPRGVEDAVGYLDHSFASARRLWEICHSREAVIDGPEDYAPTSAPTVTWDNVSYDYLKADGSIAGFGVKNVSITVPARSHTVIVGVSGSGKSTIVQLLMRYDNPSSGIITLDGVPVQRYQLDSLRRKMVLVSQKSQLLHTDIRTNVTLGRPDATDQQVWHVLKMAGIESEIQRMPDELHTQVGEQGQHLSGGQIQRLALARALLMEPAVLVLDEFTAHLHTQLEDKIRDNLAAHYSDMTIIEITHRLEAVKTADQVVLMDEGHVVKTTVPSSQTTPPS